MYSLRVWGNGHSNARIITPETVALIERWELFMPKRYADGVRKDGTTIWAIGFGHAEGGDNEPKTIPEDMELTIEQAREILAKDIAVKARWVDVRIPSDRVDLTTFMYGALVSLCFQFGQGRLDQAQTGIGIMQPFPFIKAFHAGRYVKAFTIIRDLNFKRDGTVHDGLTLRRCSEIAFAMHKIDK